MILLKSFHLPFLTILIWFFIEFTEAESLGKEYIDRKDNRGRYQQPIQARSNKDSHGGTEPQSKLRNHLSQRAKQPKVGTLNKPTKITKAKCEDTFFLPKIGYMKIRPFKQLEQCSLSFIGSHMDNCTVEMYCTNLQSTNSLDSKNCKNNFIEISDGLGGEVIGCGEKIPFSAPMKPIHNGKDLYLRFKGIAAKGTCDVFCGEDKVFYKGMEKMGASKPIPPALKEKKQIEESCVCGIKPNEGQEGRVVGGDDAIPFEFPWIAPYIFVPEKNVKDNIENSDGRFLVCGGSLINDRHVLTAAHCLHGGYIQPQDIKILLHAHILDSDLNPYELERAGTNISEVMKSIPGGDLPPSSDANENSLRMEVENFTIHPFYEPRNLDFDVAIITLKKRVNLKRTDLVRPICLPAEDDEYIRFNDDKMVEVAGWGLVDENGRATSRTLQKLQIPAIDYDDCNKLYDDELSPRHICAGHVSGGKDACQGDSGGPLIYKFNQRQYELAGIVSGGIGCARKGLAGLYTNTQEHLEWIYHNTRKAKWCKRTE